MKYPESQQIVFYDGICGLCNKLVQKILRYDRSGRIYVAPLNGKTAKSMLPANLATQNESIVYYRNGTIYTQSRAALEIARDMGGLSSLIYGFRIIPKSLRDFVYKLIARNRTKLFTTRTCPLPEKGTEHRFLN